MITSGEAKTIAQKHFPNAELLQAFAYKNQLYIFEIYEGKPSYDSPYFAVRMSDGAYRPFCPTEDLNGFFNAMRKNQIEV